MSEFEHPARSAAGHEVTVDDVHQLMGGSTPHFALQLRNRIAKLIAPLPADHPARAVGECEIARLVGLAYSGEVRGRHAQDGQRSMKSNAEGLAAR